MKKILFLIFALAFLLLAMGVPVYAHGGHGHFYGGIWIGGPVWYGGWGYPYPYYYYPYYVSPPVVIQQQQPVYQEQYSQQGDQPYYWYYCPDAQNYYPYVKQCPGGWLKVVPPSQGSPR